MKSEDRNALFEMLNEFRREAAEMEVQIQEHLGCTLGEAQVGRSITPTVTMVTGAQAGASAGASTHGSISPGAGAAHGMARHGDGVGTGVGHPAGILAQAYPEEARIPAFVHRA